MNPSGGYFLTRRVERPQFIAANLLPTRLLSFSNCICDFIPDVWAIDWVNFEPQDRVAEASKFEVSSSELPNIVTWTTDGVDSGRLKGR